MMLHKVSACIETECETVVYSKQFDKLMVTNCFTTGMWIVSYCGTHRANSQSQPFGDWKAEENGTDKRKGRLRKDWVWSWCSH